MRGAKTQTPKTRACDPEFRGDVKGQDVISSRCNHEIRSGGISTTGSLGGEKKRARDPANGGAGAKIAVLDERTRGWTSMRWRIVSEGVKTNWPGRTWARWSSPHYQPHLNYVKPELCISMLDGRIAESVGLELALHLEESRLRLAARTAGRA